jgi:hypothetical protein
LRPLFCAVELNIESDRESHGGNTKAEPWLMIPCPSPSLDPDSCDKAS